MPVTRKLIAPNKSKKWQVQKMDSAKPYVVNENPKWQMLFGPNSALSTSVQNIKIAAKFDDNTFTNLKIIGYLYDAQNASVANAATCTFKVYQITTPDWTENLITTMSGTQLANNYFYTNPLNVTMFPIDFFGGDSIMIEATIVRLGQTYRDRIYVNHLGIYDNVDRLRKDVEFLEITKKDL
jgi:hypothetical protein